MRRLLDGRPPPEEPIPFRAKLSAAALHAAAVLSFFTLAACDRKPEPLGSEQVVVVRHELGGARPGPRTKEGARLEGHVEVAARAGAGSELDEAGLRAAVERELVPALEGLAGSTPLEEAAPDAVRAALAGRLAGSGVDVVAVRAVDLHLPGRQARRELKPTSDLRILMVGLDGFDWDIAEPLMAQGRMPALSALVARGTRARLQTIQPVLSPVIWTSMATSREPQEHGILDFLGTDARGNPVPVTSNLRKTKAFWNVLGDAGETVGVVAWWATWPAEPVDGFLVSDRVAYQLFEVDDTKLPSTGKVWPPSLWRDVEPLVVRPQDVTPAEIAAFLDASVTAPPDAQDRQLLEQFAGVLAQARTYASVSLALHERMAPRVGAYYFESPDTTCHLFMRYAPPRLPEVDAVRQRRFAPVVDASYEYHDRLLARFVEQADERTVVMVVSDHGFRSGAARPTHDSRVETATAADWHERYGMFVASGPGIRAGHEVAEASILDVFPTMLALLGMPVADDLAGRVLTDAITPEHLASHPVRTVPTFETPGAQPSGPRFAEASAEDRAVLESLVAIGYVSASVAAQAGASGPTGGTGGADGPATANVHNNMGTVLLGQGDLDAAVAEFRRAATLAPDFVPARVNLAHALIQLGRTEEAVRELEAILALAPAQGKALSLLASIHLDERRLAEAEAVARSAAEKDPRSATAWYVLGGVEEALGRIDAARAAYRRSAELDPDSPEPFNAIGNSHERAGDFAGAAEWYRKALDVDPTYAAGYNNLALQYQRLGRHDEALRTYEEGRRRLGGSSVLLNNMATWHHLAAQRALGEARAAAAAGDAAAAQAHRARGESEAAAARALYEEAMAANAMDASAVNNLGALEGELGRADEQMRLYRRAVEIDPGYADAWHNIGLWHQQRAQWAEAHEAFAKALAASPDAVAALKLDALSLVRLGRDAEAVRLLEAAIARRPPAPQLVAALGAVHDESGRPREACAQYRKSLGLDARQPEVSARVAQLCR